MTRDIIPQIGGVDGVDLDSHKLAPLKKYVLHQPLTGVSRVSFPDPRLSSVVLRDVPSQFPDPERPALFHGQSAIPAQAPHHYQVLRRRIATPAQTKGSVKDVQGVLGHSGPDITANVYIAIDRVKRQTDSMQSTQTQWPEVGGGA